MSVEGYESDIYKTITEGDYYATSQQGSFEVDQPGFILNNNLKRQYKPQSFQYTTTNTEYNSAVQIGAQSFEDYKPQEPTPLDINSLVLPPPNLTCYVEPIVPRGTVTYLKHNEPIVQRTITLNFNSVKTAVRENIIHHQHNKTVITNVNRNHWHTQRIIVKDNNYHHYLINNVVRISDIHHQKIEQVRGEGKSFNDFKQTQRIEAANCEFTDKDNKAEQFGGMKQPVGGNYSVSGGGGGSSGSYINADLGSSKGGGTGILDSGGGGGYSIVSGSSGGSVGDDGGGNNNSGLAQLVINSSPGAVS